jgi:hypothetical protein
MINDTVPLENCLLDRFKLIIEVEGKPEAIEKTFNVAMYTSYHSEIIAKTRQGADLEVRTKAK